MKLPFANDRISIVSLSISILLTILVFVLSVHFNNKAEERSKKYNTLSFASTQFNIVDEAIAQKIALEGLTTDFTYKYIDANKKVEGKVFKILNTYATIGLALRHNLISVGVVSSLRKSAISSTWNDYESYIKEYRTIRNSPDAWVDFEFLATKMANNNNMEKP